MNSLLDLMRKGGYQDTNLPPPRRIITLGPQYRTQPSHAEDGDISNQSSYKLDHADRYGSMGAEVEVARICEIRMRRMIGKGQRFRLHINIHREPVKPSTFRQ